MQTIIVGVTLNPQYWQELSPTDLRTLADIVRGYIVERMGELVNVQTNVQTREDKTDM